MRGTCITASLAQIFEMPRYEYISISIFPYTPHDEQKHMDIFHRVLLLSRSSQWGRPPLRHFLGKHVRPDPPKNDPF